MIVTLALLSDTEAFANKLARAILQTEPLLSKACLVFHLQGELGSGKTTLVRSILKSLNFTGRVKSPTYSLVEIYSVHGLKFYHFDLYRIRAPSELSEIGIQDYFQPRTIAFVEWPQKGGDYIPAADVSFTITFQDETHRLLAVNSVSTLGSELVQFLDKS